MSLSCSKLIWLAGLTAIAGCAQPKPAVDPTAEAQAVRDASAAWLAASQAKDWTTSSAVFAPDGIAYPGHQDPLVGPAAIQAYYEADAAKNPNGSISWTTDDVLVAASGDLAMEIGSWVYSDGGKEVDRGKYVTNWKKVDGAWKVAADVGVSTVPEKPDSLAAVKPTTLS